MVQNKWYRVELATGPGYVGRPAIVHCRRIDGTRTQVVIGDMRGLRGQWSTVLSRALIVALAKSWAEETDPDVLKRMPR